MHCATALHSAVTCSSSPLMVTAIQSIDDSTRLDLTHAPLTLRLACAVAIAGRDGLWNKATISIFLITLIVLIVLGCARNFVSQPHTARDTKRDGTVGGIGRHG